MQLFLKLYDLNSACEVIVFVHILTSKYGYYFEHCQVLSGVNSVCCPEKYILSLILGVVNYQKH